MMNLNILNITHRALFPRSARGTLPLVGALLLIAPWPSFSQEVSGGCGSVSGGHDYRPDKYKPTSNFPNHRNLLDVVQRHHFTPEVENLIRAKSGYIAGDLSYTLRVFPNHHRALMAMVALSEKEKTSSPAHSDYSVECWFQRAVARSPDDNVVRMIYARYLAKANRVNEAEQQLSIATSQAGDNAFTHNNIGLIFFDMKEYEKSLVHAHKAYELGLEIPTLKEQLKSVGKWSESVATSPVEPAKDPQ